MTTTTQAEASITVVPQTEEFDPRPMRTERRIADFFIKDCRFVALHDGKLQKLMREVLDEIDFQHLRDSNPCPVFTDRAAMHSHLHDTVIGNQPVDYLEFGVFEGESIRHWSNINSATQSRFFGFDSFEGLPEKWKDGEGKGAFYLAGATPKIDDTRVEWVKGWFENTVPQFACAFTPQNRLILHLDADLYSSTMIALMHFTRFMQSGTLLLFDELYDRDHEFKALVDWQQIIKKSFRALAQMENYSKTCFELL